MINTNQNQNSNNANNNQNKPQTYKVVRLIGEGAFGKAYLVECIADKSLCVIKTINIDNLSDQEKKETLLEAKILEKLDHPNIIKFREVFISKKPRFSLNIVTDFADGGDLQRKIKAQKGKYFSETHILDWFTQICLALKHLHDKKILHRDLKSQNIFMTENGMIKLGDFGIAKCLECTYEKAITVVGTPYYLSPEIVNNKPYSFQSDIWSLGVLLYEITALKMPFDGSSLPMLSLKIIKGNYNPLPLTFSKDLRTLVAMLLIVDYHKRPSINEILKLPLIKSRVKSFLTEIEYSKEFSHTIIHNYNVLKDRGSHVSRHNSSNNNSEAASTQENSRKNNSNNSSGNKNQNVVFNLKPPQEIKKKEVDNKEIAEVLKKVDMKRKNPLPVKENNNSKEVKKPSQVVSNFNSNNIITPVKDNKDSGNKEICQVNNYKQNDEGNPLKELMKKARAELRSKPKEEIVWLGKEKEKEIKKKEEKEIKFPKVIIVDKGKPINKENNIIDINSNNNLVPNKKKKEEEEIYNLNRYLNELAKLENEEENDSETDSNKDIETKASEDNLNDARDYNEVEETEVSNYKESNSSEFSKTIEEETNTDNSQIEQLRIELENSLGFLIFKKVYKIVEENTDPYLIKCDFENLKELIIKEFLGRFDKKVIESAIDKIPEVFAIVVRERIAIFKYK